MRHLARLNNRQFSNREGHLNRQVLNEHEYLVIRGNAIVNIPAQYEFDAVSSAEDTLTKAVEFLVPIALCSEIDLRREEGRGLDAPWPLALRDIGERHRQ